MAMTEKIKILLIKRKMTAKQLAEKIGRSPGNMSNRFSKDDFSEKELTEIADVLGCDFEAHFILRDTGEKV